MSLKKYLIETCKFLLRCDLVIHRYIKEIDQLYEMSARDLEKRNKKRFIEMFRCAYDKSPFYHKLYSEAGIRRDDIQGLADIKKLPIVTKEMVKRHANEMLTIPRWQVISAHTSGTTGTPLTTYSSWPSIWMSQAYTYCTRRRNGYTYGQPLVSLRGNLDKSQVFMKVHISNTLYLSSYNINPKTVEHYHQLIVKHKPVAIEGYPSSLYSLALVLKDAGLKLTIPVAFTSSETLFDYQRVLIEEILGTEIFDNYGMGEQTIYLQETYNHQGYYEMPGYSINEYEEDGEICTSLINKAFPMIRYRSTDIMHVVDVTEEKKQLLVQRVGKSKNNYLCYKDGTRIMRLGDVLKDVKHVKYVQLIQDKTTLLGVRIVPEAGFEDVDQRRIEQNLSKHLRGGNIDYHIELVTEQEMNNSSKDESQFSLILKSIDTKNIICGIIGRIDDYLVCKDGSRMSRVDFVESGKHIKACQWIQKEKGKITVCIVPDDGFTKKDESYVVKETEKRVGSGNMDITVKLITMKELIYSKRGKFKLIVNLLE